VPPGPGTHPGGRPAPLHDLVVVGGGPVGLAAALRAAAAGLDVVVLEPRGVDPAAPVDKACGEGLLPGALAAVHDLGVDPPGAPLTGIAYEAPRRGGRTWRAEHDFAAGPGRGVRRTALHAALAGRVLEVGVPVRRARVLDLAQDGARVQLATDDGPVRGRWVLGCDGLHSTVRRAAGLELPAGRPAVRFGVRRHAAVAPWSSRVEVHWGRDVEGYVTPVGPHEVGVAVLGPRGTAFEAGLAQLPALAERLQGAAWTTTARGAGPLLQRARSAASDRVLLAGDAAGYVDALTGEGLRVGLAAAEAAVGVLTTRRSRWVADAYERAWRRETRSFRVTTAALLAASRPAPLRGVLVPLAAAAPPVFAAVVDGLAR